MNATKDIGKVNRIIDAVCEEFQVEKKVLLSPTREQHYIYIRHCIVYTVKRVLNINISCTKMGKLMKRNHASILHGVKTAMNLIVTDNNEFVRYMNRVIKVAKYATREEIIIFNHIAQL